MTVDAVRAGVVAAVEGSDPDAAGAAAGAWASLGDRDRRGLRDGFCAGVVCLQVGCVPVVVVPPWIFAVDRWAANSPREVSLGCVLAGAFVRSAAEGRSCPSRLLWPECLPVESRPAVIEIADMVVAATWVAARDRATAALAATAN